MNKDANLSTVPLIVDYGPARLRQCVTCAWHKYTASSAHACAAFGDRIEAYDPVTGYTTVQYVNMPSCAEARAVDGYCGPDGWAHELDKGAK